MQELVLDLHIHSRFSRAVSPRMNIPNMYLWGRKKGINILSVTDFTHPVWFKEASSQLEEISEGVYKYKFEEKVKQESGEFFTHDSLGPYFILSTEVAAIYTENGRGHRIHNLIFAPNFAVAAKINAELTSRGVNLMSDGRPTLGRINTKELLEILLSIDQKIALIPCHVWTPWFSLYGSRSGYDHITECFGEFTGRIFAIETGLSSDPSMNWRIKELSTRSIVSFSDAHSLEKMGREATVLRLKGGNSKSEIRNPKESSKSQIQNLKIKPEDITYSNILNGFVRGKERVFEIGYTIEFYPEEGKYHYTGHRNCGVSYAPADTPKDAICPVCHRPLVVGVMHRVDELAASKDLPADQAGSNFTYETDTNGVVWVKDPTGVRPPFVSLVPLLEIISECLNNSVSSQNVLALYNQLVSRLGSEHEVIFRSPYEKIKEVGGVKVAEAIKKVRSRNIEIKPGFDGEYGKVAIWSEASQDEDAPSVKEQTGFGF